MTAQIAERLRYLGQDMVMCTEPLGDYFAMGGARPPFDFSCTALWRGYVGSWEIAGDRLYLSALQGGLTDGTPATLGTIFPDFPERVFAHWYTGTLRVPQGRLLSYRHMGYGSVYERDLLLDVKRGFVVSSRIRHNGTIESEEVAEGYRVNAMTVYAHVKSHTGDTP